VASRDWKRDTSQQLARVSNPRGPSLQEENRRQRLGPENCWIQCLVAWIPDTWTDASDPHIIELHPIADEYLDVWGDAFRREQAAGLLE